MRFNTTKIVATAVSFAAVYGVLSFAHASTASPSSAASTPASPAKSLLPVLTRDQTDTDLISSSVGTAITSDFAAGSARALGTQNGVEYWAAVDTSGEVCIVALTPGSDKFAASSCATPTAFLAQGLSLQFTTATSDITAALLPGGYQLSGGLAAIGNQLWAGPTSEIKSALSAVSASGSSQTLKLRTLGKGAN